MKTIVNERFVIARSRDLANCWSHYIEVRVPCDNKNIGHNKPEMLPGAPERFQFIIFLVIHPTIALDSMVKRLTISWLD